jgi:hypothetical protein
MVDVITNIEINVPINKLAAYACNPDHAPEWYVNIQSVEWKTAKPLQVGSKIDFTAKFMGKELTYTYEVVEFSSQKFVMKTAEGPFPMETSYSFSAQTPDSSIMTLRNKGKPSGFSRLFTPFISFMMRRANNKDLKMIKSILEKSIDQSPE